MKLHHFPHMLMLLLLTLHATAGEEDGSTETNEIIPRQAIQKLDLSVRQALLRAIDKLEKEAANDDATTIDVAPDIPTSPTIIETKDEILEESTNSALDVVPTVQFFTATLDEKNTEEQLLSSFIDHSKIWKKVNKKPINGDPLTVASDPTQTVETPNNRQSARSVSNAFSANEIAFDDGSDEIKFEIRHSKTQAAESTTATPATTAKPTQPPRPPRKRTTTTTTTTTTTPRPTHNEDGENIEIVDKGDIKIQEAPLVTAFTVDLDERGTTKNVVPLVHNTAPANPTRNFAQFAAPHVGPTITKLNVLPGIANTLPQSAAQTQTTTTSATGSITTTTLPILSTTTVLNAVPPTGHYITKTPLTGNFQNSNNPAGNVNNFLLQKQRELEQQIFQLKLQAQQQQELILRQLKLIEEQSKYGNTQGGQVAATNIQPAVQQQVFPIPSLQSIPLQSTTQQIQLTGQQLQQQQLPQEQREIGFTIRPSIEVIPSNSVKATGPTYAAFPVLQQLPLKDAANQFNLPFSGNDNNNNNRNNNDNNNNNNNNSNNFNTNNNNNNVVQHVFENLKNFHTNNNNQNTNVPQSAIPQAQQQQQQSVPTTTVQIQPSVSSTQFSFAPTFATLPNVVQQQAQPQTQQQLLQQQPQLQQTVPQQQQLSQPQQQLLQPQLQQQFQQANLQQQPFQQPQLQQQQPQQNFQQQLQQQQLPQQTQQQFFQTQQQQQQFSQPQQQFQQQQGHPQQSLTQPQSLQQQQNLAQQQQNPTGAQPLEVSIVQSLPLLDYQQFQKKTPQRHQQLVPNYISDAIKQQEQHRARQFRQEVGTSNFAGNQVQIQQSNSFPSVLPASLTNAQQPLQQQQQQQQFIENQNFYRQHLDPKFSNQLQQNAQFYQQRQQAPSTALNHGINNFAPPNVRGI